MLKHNQTRRTSALRKSALLVQGDIPTIADFDKKLTETDCYLQILLNQVAALKVKIDDPLSSPDAKAKYEEIAEKAIAMTESIKHGIVLLQIAKNATIPEGSVAAIDLAQVSSSQQQVDSASTHRSPVSRPSASKMKAPFEIPFSDGNIETGIEMGAECKEKVQQRQEPKFIGGQASPNLKPLKSTAIPEISYSSSEDEDFFDAEEDEDEPPEDTPQKMPSKTIDLVISESPVVALERDLQSPLTPVEGRDDVDWDALYGVEDEEDVDMKSHGSVITHLLSQVRIGMDLTKIVLPTFILERRSLLEMYSDFFAHPDLFVQITDGTSPEDRMVRVLKWYMSSFHAGRKSSIAKKPYNPILGETFRCHWNVNNDSNEIKSEEQNVSNSGPLPWCRSDDLTFVAEQVSHHPPISAFYAEHVKKRISVNAHIYTKSSFLGMSVSSSSSS